ncbi:hypothetical protein [Streptomyces sp. NBC_00354]|uniref:hypothetical protein n=1 Tax=Streptomyces sp. NBC_00354 TaxID=2975723 RepID=UPI002E254FC7
MNALARPVANDDVSYDHCGPPGASPGTYGCDSQTPETGTDLQQNLDFISAYRNRLPYNTLDANQIADRGHHVCKHLETVAESQEVGAWLNVGWTWDEATWLVGTSENFFCPSQRGGDVVIPNAEPAGA